MYITNCGPSKLFLSQGKIWKFCFLLGWLPCSLLDPLEFLLLLISFQGQSKQGARPSPILEGSYARGGTEDTRPHPYTQNSYRLGKVRICEEKTQVQ